MLPPARLFPENGHVVMRSDWTEDATYALFRCGRYGEIDGRWGRNNADNLHFLINKRGILAADTGAVHSLNNAALGFAGSQVHSDDLPHIRAYARQTIAHNSITVGSKPLELRARNNALLATVHGGGQSPIQDDSWRKSWDCPKPKAGDRPFREGRIIAYETSPLFDYAAGDATHSYPPGRLKSITRQSVYLRPDTFVVFDRVVNAEPGLQTRRLTAGFVLDLRREPRVGKALMFFQGPRWPEGDPRGGWANHVSLGMAWSDDLVKWSWPGKAATGP